MGVRGLLTHLGTYVTRSRQIFRGARNGEDTTCLPLVFDEAVLFVLLFHEWHKLSSSAGNSSGLAYRPSRGAWVTQFRGFAAAYLRCLVHKLGCILVWVRDGEVNSGVRYMPENRVEFLHWACSMVDDIIRGAGSSISPRNTAVDVAVELCLSKKYAVWGIIDYAVSQAWLDAELGEECCIVHAPADQADAEAWRQGRRLAHQHKTSAFVVSSDTDMLIFGKGDDDAFDVGVIILDLCEDYEAESKDLSNPGASSGTHAKSARGAKWSCDLSSDSNSLFFTYCTNTEISRALKVRPSLLPLAAACLGNDYSPYDFTATLTSKLLARHFEDPMVARAFRGLSASDRQERRRVSNLQQQGRLARKPLCKNGEFCGRVGCTWTHPGKGNMRCRAEREEGGQGRCANPVCRYRHEHPMAYCLDPSVLSGKLGIVVTGNKPTTFDTWDEAVQAVDGLKNEQNPYIGRSGLFGVGLKYHGRLRRQAFKEVLQWLSKDVCGTLGNDVPDSLAENKSTRRDEARDADAARSDASIAAVPLANHMALIKKICRWIDGTTEEEMEIFVFAVRHYDLLPLDEDPPPVEMIAPTRVLERWRVHKFRYRKPYAVPSDSGSLSYICEPLRATLGSLLGLEGEEMKEAVQVGNKYAVVDAPVFPKKRRIASESLAAIFPGSGDEPDGDGDGWLRGLDDILECLPGLLTPNVCRKQGKIMTAPLKTVIRGLMFWERYLLEIGDRLDEFEANNSGDCLLSQTISPLERWEINAFVSSCVLGWVQLGLKGCPFNLLGESEARRRSDGDGCLSQVEGKLRRRVFLLLAQFFDVNAHVQQMMICAHGKSSSSVRGMVEVFYNPEAIMLLFVEGARGNLTAQERDNRVRSKLESVIRSAGTTPARGLRMMSFSPIDGDSAEQILEVCERLINLVSSTTEGMRVKLMNDEEVVEDWEDLADEFG